jgi:hypothetical protein
MLGMMEMDGCDVLGSGKGEVEKSWISESVDAVEVVSEVVDEDGELLNKFG